MFRIFIKNIIFTSVPTFLIGLILFTLNTFNPFLFFIFLSLFIWFGYRSLSFAFSPNKATLSIKADVASSDSKFELNPSFIPPFGFIATFGLICHQLNLYDNSLFTNATPTVSKTICKNEWALYTLDNLIRSVFFDFLETYHIKISHIDSNNMWILTFVFVFKSLLSIFFIKSLLNLLKAFRAIENEIKI